MIEGHNSFQTDKDKDVQETSIFKQKSNPSQISVKIFVYFGKGLRSLSAN